MLQAVALIVINVYLYESLIWTYKKNHPER